MNLILVKKEIRCSAKEVKERNKKCESEKGKVIRNLLEINERILRTLVEVVYYEPILNTSGKVMLLLQKDTICYFSICISLLETKLFSSNRMLNLNTARFLWGKKKNHFHLLWHKHKSVLMVLPLFFVLFCFGLIKAGDLVT